MKKLRPGEARTLVKAHEVNSCEAWAQSPEFLATRSLLLPWHVWWRTVSGSTEAAGKARGCVPTYTLWEFLLCPIGYAFSEDGEYFAYGLSASGSDWVTIKFMKVDGAKELPDVLERVKFSCMAWTHDGKGMFYNSYPQQDGKSDGKWRWQVKRLFHEIQVWLHMTWNAKLYVEVVWCRPRFPQRVLYQLALLYDRAAQNLVS